MKKMIPPKPSGGGVWRCVCACVCVFTFNLIMHTCNRLIQMSNFPSGAHVSACVVCVSISALDHVSACQRVFVFGSGS